MAKFTDSELDAHVLFFLKQHVGKEQPIGRWEIVAKIFGPDAALEHNDSNYADRQVRDAVERLRHGGALICDMGNGEGRFMASTLEEYQSFRAKYGSMAFKIIATLSEMDKAAAQAFELNPLQPRLI